SLATTTAGAGLLSGIAPSGSPTYAIFAIVLGAMALTWGSTTTERVLGRVDERWGLALLLFISLLAVVLRAGVEVPIVSRLARPLLAEREKTKQLETLINWVLSSEYRGSRLVLEEAVNPVDGGRDVIERWRRPPTYQEYLDEYLASRVSLDGSAPTL